MDFVSAGPAHPTLRRNMECTLLNQPAGVPLERAGLKVFFPEEQDEDIDLVEERPEVHITAYGPAPPSRRRNMEKCLMTLLPRGAELERARLKLFLPSNDELDGGVTQEVEEHDDDNDVQITRVGPSHPARRIHMEQTLLKFPAVQLLIDLE